MLGASGTCGTDTADAMLIEDDCGLEMTCWVDGGTSALWDPDDTCAGVANLRRPTDCPCGESASNPSSYLTTSRCQRRQFKKSSVRRWCRWGGPDISSAGQGALCVFGVGHQNMRRKNGSSPASALR
eukprot:Polyplicarium_translucidae@DN3325_c0_g1_i5.p1